MSITFVKKGFWAGTVESLYEVLEKQQLISEKMNSDTKLAIFQDEEDNEVGNPYLSVVGPVAIVDITGPLVNTDSPLNYLFGLTSYPAIKDAIIEATNDNSVKEIVLNIDSPGGTANGAFELARFIRDISDNVKPIKAVTGGTMASAAYLLGSAASEIIASPTSVVGSIGVISIHQDHTKALEDDGIKVTVIRSGKYKALGNPYEELTEEAKSILQEHSDAFYMEFLTDVARYRGKSVAEVQERMADGREFLGRKAQTIGLVDKIGYIDNLIAELVSKYASLEASRQAPREYGMCTSVGNNETGDESMSRKKSAKLTPELQAQIASGVPISALPDAEDTSVDANAEVEGDGVEVKATSEQEGKPSLGAEESTPEVKASADEQAEVVEKEPANDALVSFLRNELQAANEKLTKLSVELERANAKLEEMNSVVPGMEDIVRAAMVRMEIGMGNGQASYDHLSGAALVAQYHKVNARFEERFPVGGVAKLEAKSAGEDFVDENSVTARLGAISL